LETYLFTNQITGSDNKFHQEFSCVDDDDVMEG